MITVELGQVVIDPRALAAYTRAGNGPVIADLMRRGTNVQTGARMYVGKRTRALERSIIKRLDFIGGDPVVRVGTDLGYALWEHEGTRPHVIRPKNRKVLRFPTPGGGGGVVFAQRVNHPGTKGTHYLARALPLALH